MVGEGFLRGTDVVVTHRLLRVQAFFLTFYGRILKLPLRRTGGVRSTAFRAAGRKPAYDRPIGDQRSAPPAIWDQSPNAADWKVRPSHGYQQSPRRCWGRRGRRQRTEDRGQRTEGRGQRAEDRGRRAARGETQVLRRFSSLIHYPSASLPSPSHFRLPSSVFRLPSSVFFPSPPSPSHFPIGHVDSRALPGYMDEPALTFPRRVCHPSARIFWGPGS